VRKRKQKEEDIKKFYYKIYQKCTKLDKGKHK
jgi:hypothetical protein